MSKKINILSKIIFLFLVLSCNKKESIKNSNSSEIYASVQSGNQESSFFDNCFVLYTSQTYNPMDTLNSYRVNVVGKYGSEGDFKNAGQLMVNNRAITPNSNGIYDYEYTGSNLAEGKSLRGNTITVSNTGSSDVEARTINVYVPTSMYSYSGGLYFPTQSISKNSGVPLHWNPDPNNVIGDVFLQVYYYKGLSLSRDANFPSSLDGLTYQIPDNGSFTIPPSDLARFPIGSVVGISLGRASYIQQALPRVRFNYIYCLISDVRSLPLDVLR